MAIFDLDVGAPQLPKSSRTKYTSTSKSGLWRDYACDGSWLRWLGRFVGVLQPQRACGRSQHCYCVRSCEQIDSSIRSENDLTPISLSTDAYCTVRALQYAEKWKIAFVKPAVQRELTSLGLATVEDDCLVITPTGMTVPRMPEPATSSHLR